MKTRRSLQVAAALAACGLVLAGVLAREHAQAHAGVASFCAINDVVNCDRVATSRYSVVLGLPVAVWGALAYAVALVLAVAGLRARRPHAAWPAGLLFLLGLAATAAAVALALVSKLAIGAFCILCAGSWAVSIALLAAAWQATRPDGPAAAVRSDLALLAARPGRTAAVALAGVALVLLVAAAYPRYWEKASAGEARAPSSPAAPGPGSGAPPAGAPATSAPAAAMTPAPPVVVVFSDYECPFCAVAHEEAKKVLAARPDVRLVKKHFPLDPSCNPAVKRAMHPNACAWAAAAVCAEEQGKLPAMDDALFRHQKSPKPLAALATEVGLDPRDFEACLAAPSTLRRIQADIAAALAVGIQATPTYVVNGKPQSGMLRPEALPPPVSAAKAP